MPQWPFRPLLTGYEEPETLSAEELEALRKSVAKEARTKLGPAIKLVEIGDVATIEYLEKELGIRERVHATIAKLERRLLLLRGIKSISSSQPLLEAAE